MPREERSAGVLIFRENADSPTGRLFLLLDYGNFWDYPKGHLEPGETDLQAARREVAEETGITNFSWIPGFAHQIQYFYRDKKRGLIHKTVVFFLARTSVSEITLSHEHSGFKWLDDAAAQRQLKYPGARHVLKAAIDFLSHPNQSVANRQ